VERLEVGLNDGEEPVRNVSVAPHTERAKTKAISSERKRGIYTPLYLGG
jgi:hypothetical protein